MSCRGGQRQRRDRELVLARRRAAARGWSPGPARPGQRGSRSATTGAASQDLLEVVEDQQHAAFALGSRRSASSSGGHALPALRARWRSLARTSAGSRSCAPGRRRTTPSAKASTSSRRRCRASRVLPVPPGRSGSPAARRGPAGATAARCALAAEQGVGWAGRSSASARAAASASGIAPADPWRSELEDPLRRSQVVQAMLAEVAQASRLRQSIVRDQSSAPPREQDLATVRRASRRASRLSGRPGSRRRVRCGLPACSAIRTRSGPIFTPGLGSASARWPSRAAASGRGAVAKAACEARRRPS